MFIIKGNFKKLLLIFVFLVVLLGVLLCVIFIDNNKEPNNDNNDNNLQQVEIIASDISMYINERPKDFVYTLNGIDGDCDIQITSSNDNIKIEDNKIVPQKTGQTSVQIKVVYLAKEYTKTITVTIKEIVATAKFYDNSNLVDKIFVTKSYKLVIELNENIDQDFEILTSENIENFSCSKNNGNNLEFTFKVEKYSKTEFVFNYKTLTQTFCIDCYELIDNFNLTFSNGFSDIINLYLFDDSYKNLANQDNCFDSTSFSVSLKDTNIKDYNIEILDSSIAGVSLDNICALKAGETVLKITANDGSEYCEEYKIVVSEVFVSNLIFDLEEVSLMVGQSFSFNLSYSPLYALNNIEVYADEGLLLENNTVTALSEGEFFVYAKDVLTNLTTKIKVTVDTDEIKTANIQIEFNDSFLSNNEATFADNCLTINNLKDNNISFSYKIIGDLQVTDISCNIEIMSKNNKVYSTSNTYNIVTISTNGQDEFSVVLTLKENNLVTFSFDVIIV